MWSGLPFILLNEFEIWRGRFPINTVDHSEFCENFYKESDASLKGINELSLYRKCSQKRYSMFWDVTQRRLVVSCRRFGRTYRSHLDSYWTTWFSKTGPLLCPETSVTTNLRYITSQKSKDLICSASETWNDGNGQFFCEIQLVLPRFESFHFSFRSDTFSVSFTLRATCILAY
jgi:hypothetical protein